MVCIVAEFCISARVQRPLKKLAGRELCIRARRADERAETVRPRTYLDTRQRMKMERSIRSNSGSAKTKWLAQREALG